MTVKASHTARPKNAAPVTRIHHHRFREPATAASPPGSYARVGLASEFIGPVSWARKQQCGERSGARCIYFAWCM